MNIPYLFSIEFFIYFLYFVVAIFLSFYIPGNLLIRKFKLPFLENITICIITGMILLILQGLIFGYLGIRWASYIYIFLSLIAWIYLIKKNQLKIPKIKIDFSPLLIILFGIFGQLSAIWLMGSRFTNGVRILGGHPPDNNVNLSIINELIHRFPPFEPGMYGVPLQNYHYLSHLLNAEFIRIFNLPLITTNYQYMTIVLSLLLGLIAISLANMLNLGKKFKIWFLFLLYFGADLSFAIIFLLGKGINFDMKAMESGPDFLFNMPRAFAIVIFFGALYLLMLFLKKRSIILAFIIGIALGLLIGIKIYVGFFALVGIITFSIYETYRKRYKALIILAVSIITALIVYLPVNSNAGGLFFTGFWRISDFMVHPSLGLSSFEMARQIYQQHNNPKVYIFEILFLLLYLINTFGLRFLAFVQTKKSLSKLPVELNIFLIPAILISMVFGLFFMQKTGGANTFNFLTTALIISSLYAALSISFIQSK